MSERDPKKSDFQFFDAPEIIKIKKPRLSPPATNKPDTTIPVTKIPIANMNER